MEKELNKNDGNVPVLYISARTIPEAWQTAMIELWNKGMDVPTSFDRPGDPPSKDATVMVEVKEPLGEPRIHKNFPHGPGGLEHYRLEVTHGVHDHWVNRFGDQWNYSYHERLRRYDVGTGEKVDQLKNMVSIIEKKSKEGKDLTNRRFQIITWIPSVDPFILDPPCLQRLHFRLAPNNKEGYNLNLNTDWRSRDGYKAWFMNVYAMTELQRLISQELTERCGIKIGVGRYCDKSDSLHIYGQDFKGVMGFKEFLENTKKKSLDELTWNTEDIKTIMIEARHILAAQLDYESKTGIKTGINPELEKSEKLLEFPYPKEWDE